jgi:uncharacterized membrane protein
VISIQHIHPMIVHFPIVFVLMLAVFDLIATARGANLAARTAAGNLSTGLSILAAVSAIAAFVLGDMALEFAAASGFVSPVADMHERLALILVIGLLAWAAMRSFMWWRNKPLPDGSSYLLPVMAIAGAGLVMATAYYGGQLVYDLGVNVSKLSPQVKTDVPAPGTGG